MTNLNDTIAAIATAVGEGGLSVIRVSGQEAIQVVDRGFRGKKAIRDVSSQTAHFGEFKDRYDVKIDEIVATVFRTPHSYTTEDVVEISCHGGVYVTKKILAELIEYGARFAEPGEFTKRAFLNGRIDLSQAEAVADLIHSRSKFAHRASLQQLNGRISEEVKTLRQNILDLSSLLELELDFSEEGIDIIRQAEVIERLEAISNRINELLSTYRRGRIFREGVRVVLAGRPNAGKSSILNGLLEYERAIVSDIPGTTRDTLEENISIEGLLFNVIDTAGLRENAEKVEELGIMRAEEELRNADIILFVIDSSLGFMEEDLLLIDRHSKKADPGETRIIILENKIDLLSGIRREFEESKLQNISRVRMSAKNRVGYEELRNELLKSTRSELQHSFDSSCVVTSQRHQECLKRASDYIKQATSNTKTKVSSELIAEDLHMCSGALGEIIGIMTSDDVLSNIFSHFCIGK